MVTSSTLQPDETNSAEARAVGGASSGQMWVGVGLALLTTAVFFLTAKANQEHFDYTARIASALLHGQVGLQEQPPSWLNEMVPRDGRYYSVFPLGAVLSMLPVALLQSLGWLHRFPGRDLAALLAGCCAYFLFGLSALEGRSLARRSLLSLFPIFAAWTWCNLGFGGAWHLALGFAVLGEAAALYFILVERRFLLAGAFFALAFGNRTELILSCPVYLYLCVRPAGGSVLTGLISSAVQNWRSLLLFLIVPVLLGLATAGYNYTRFGSIFDFGYTHIPNVLKEPWYQHGLFSFHAIPWNIHKMLFEGMEDIPQFPYLRPHAFGCSIFIASPILFLLFREGGNYRLPCWSAIALLTFALWCHGNPGGWQFSYRYGMTLLPWMYLLIIGNGPRKLTVIEISLFLASIAINAIATYQFLWTDQIHP